MLALFSLSSQPVTSCLLASRKCCVDRLRPPRIAAPTPETGRFDALKTLNWVVSSNSILGSADGSTSLVRAGPI